VDAQIFYLALKHFADGTGPRNLIALLLGQRAFAANRLHSPHDGDQSQASFVLLPELESCAGILSMNAA